MCMAQYDDPGVVCGRKEKRGHIRGKVSMYKDTENSQYGVPKVVFFRLFRGTLLT